MDDKGKINLYSKYPTVSLNWERGIKGVFKSTGSYKRFEFDLQHKVRLGLMRTLYYRFGLGAFTNQDEMYFVDFVNFSNNNLPVGWNDNIGGVFQLLDGECGTTPPANMSGDISLMKRLSYCSAT